MAKQEQQQQKSELEKRVDAQYEQAMNKIRQEQNKKRMEQDKQQFLAKQQELAETAAEVIMEYGRENYLSQILMTFLDVSIQMEGAIKTMQAVEKAMTCIGQAMNCMDSILDSYKLILEGSMEHKYGFWQRRKNKRQLKKAISNNVGRMMQICDSLVGSQELALSVATSLEKASRKMQAAMEKNQKKQAKRQAKLHKGEQAPAVNSTKAEQMVKAIVESRNGNYEEPVSGGGVSDSGADDKAQPAGGGSGTVKDSGIDDII